MGYAHDAEKQHIKPAQISDHLSCPSGTANTEAAKRMPLQSARSCWRVVSETAARQEEHEYIGPNFQMCTGWLLSWLRSWLHTSSAQLATAQLAAHLAAEPSSPTHLAGKPAVCDESRFAIQNVTKLGPEDSHLKV
jgi:hypothetical protein